MKINRIGKLLWNLIGRRAIMFYLLVSLILAGAVDHEAVVSHARGAALSRLIPSFEYLSDFSAGSATLDLKKLHEYAFYFERKLDSFQKCLFLHIQLAFFAECSYP